MFHATGQNQSGYTTIILDYLFQFSWWWGLVVVVRINNYMSNVFGLGLFFPPRIFAFFCIWYLIFKCLVSKRYLFSMFLVSIWYLIDTKWTWDTQLHPWVQHDKSYWIYNNVSVLDDGGTFDASPETTS